MKRKCISSVIFFCLITCCAFAQPTGYGGLSREFGPSWSFELWHADPNGYFGASVDASPPSVQTALDELGASYPVVTASPYVPYTGAHSNVDLGAYYLTATNLTITDRAQLGNASTDYHAINKSPNSTRMLDGIFSSAAANRTMAGYYLDIDYTGAVGGPGAGDGSVVGYEVDLDTSSAVAADRFLNLYGFKSNVRTDAAPAIEDIVSAYGGHFTGIGTDASEVIYGIWASATGGKINYAAWFDAGDVYIVSGSLYVPSDTEKIYTGAGNDREDYHSGSHGYTTINTGDYYISAAGGDIDFSNENLLGTGRIYFDHDVSGTVTESLIEAQGEMQSTTQNTTMNFFMADMDLGSTYASAGTQYRIGYAVDNAIRHNQTGGTFYDFGGYFDMGSLAELPFTDTGVDYFLTGLELERNFINVGSGAGGSWNDVTAIGLKLTGWEHASDLFDGIAGTFTRYAIYSDGGDVELTDGDIDTTGTTTAGTLTDGTTSITGGNYTGVGNITGSDVDISAGTGDFTTTGTISDGVLTLSDGSITSAVNGTFSGTVQAEHLISTDDAYITNHLGIGDSTPSYPIDMIMSAADTRGISIDGTTNDFTGVGGYTLFMDRDIDFETDAVPSYYNMWNRMEMIGDGAIDGTRYWYTQYNRLDNNASVTNAGDTDYTHRLRPFFLYVDDGGIWDTGGAGKITLTKDVAGFAYDDDCTLADSGGGTPASTLVVNGLNVDLDITPTVSGGAWTIQTRGTYVDIFGSGAGTSTAIGHYIYRVISADTNYGIYIGTIGSDANDYAIYDVSGRNWIMDSDSAVVGFGAGGPGAPDGTIGHDGDSLNIIANAVTGTDDMELTADTLQVNAVLLATDKIAFTQVDENEYIDSLNDGYVDIGATTAIRLLQDTNITGNLFLSDNYSAQFRDAQLYVNSDADGYLDLHADVAIRLTAPDTLMEDLGLFDETPHLTFADSDDGSDIAFMWHLDTADTTWGYYQLWRGTDVDGKSFAVNPNIPLMYFDSSNDIHFPDNRKIYRGDDVYDTYTGSDWIFDMSTAPAQADAFAVKLYDKIGAASFEVLDSDGVGQFVTDSDGNTQFLGTLDTGGVIRGLTSLWWETHHHDMINANPGASGAAFTSPNANTAGGYTLTLAGHLLYWAEHVHSDWDAGSDVEIIVIFENGAQGAVGNTIDLQLQVYMKGEGEAATKLQTLENAVTINDDAAFTQYQTTFTIDYDDGANPLDVGDHIGLILHMETDSSEVDNAIINHAITRYRTAKVKPEI